MNAAIEVLGRAHISGPRPFRNGTANSGNDDTIIQLHALEGRHLNMNSPPPKCSQWTLKRLLHKDIPYKGEVPCSVPTSIELTTIFWLMASRK